MKKIKVLGSGCARCTALYETIKARAEALQVACEVEKVTDMAEIAACGVMSTPAIVIDEKVVHAGSVPTGAAIDQWLKGENEGEEGGGCCCCGCGCKGDKA